MSGKRGQMQPFTAEHVEAIATYITRSDKLHARRDLALLRMGVDTMLRSVDLLKLRVDDIVFNGDVVETFRVEQKKTKGWVRCLMTERTRITLKDFLNGRTTGTLFPICRRRYRQIIDDWCEAIHLDKRRYSTHSLRRTKAAHIYRTTRDIAAVQKLLGHARMTYTQEYLGVSEDAALDLARNATI